MPSSFVDSSALVKRYQDEEGSARLNGLMENAKHLLIARLTVVEVSSALVRRARSTRLLGHDLASTLADFDLDVRESFEIVELHEPVMIAAVGMSRKHGLRGADAIQLACALLAFQSEPFPREFYLISADDELNAAAAAEGLQVENPNLYP
jgi:predicted nucleic acid-binding protein